MTTTSSRRANRLAAYNAASSVCTRSLVNSQLTRLPLFFSFVLYPPFGTLYTQKRKVLSLSSHQMPQLTSSRIDSSTQQSIPISYPLLFCLRSSSNYASPSSQITPSAHPHLLLLHSPNNLPSATAVPNQSSPSSRQRLLASTSPQARLTIPSAIVTKPPLVLRRITT